MRCLKTVFWATFLVFSLFATSWAWQEENTHPPITEAAVKETKINDFLVKQLKISEGLAKSLIDGDGLKKQIGDWIKYGSTQEDRPKPGIIRGMRHFHDPLVETWSNAGTVGMSSIYWSQKENQHDAGKYSWPDVRYYFFLANTLPTKVEREAYLAETFRGVGQLMHLVEDVAVPLHTRNDIHVYRKDVEGWANDEARTRSILENNPYTGAGDPGTLFPSWVQGDEYAPCPVSALWDIN